MNSKYRVLLRSSLVVCGLLLCSQALASFPDVPSNHPNATAIGYVQVQDIVSGYPDGTFRPNNTINRAEFTKIVTLYKFGQEMIDKCGSRMQFSDLFFDAWYVKYVCRAKDGHLIDGYSDGTFRPEQFINFAEAAKIIALTDTYNADDPRLPTDDGGAWYNRYVRYLSNARAIPLSITSLDQQITRSEMAEMIWRLKAEITDKPSRTYEEIASYNQGISLKSYSNETYGFSMKIPADATAKVYEGSLQDSIVFSRNGKDAFSVDIRKDAAATDIRLFYYLDNPIESYGTLGGEDAVISRAPGGYCDGPGCSQPFAVISAKKGNYIYSLNFSGDAVFSDEEQRIINSFAFSTINTAYTNKRDGYSIALPAGWTVQENTQADDSLNGVVNNNAIGTKIIAPQSNQPFVFIAITPSCPDLSRNFEPTPSPSPGRTVTIDGRTFATANMSDGAAGSIGEDTYYASKIDATHCFVIATFYFHSTGDANDEPERSRVKEQIAQMNTTLSRIVQSLKLR